MFDNFEYLAFNNPFYFLDDGRFIIRKRFNEIVESYNQDVYIDTTAIVELLSKNYILADRSIIKNIYHSPWHAKPNKEFNSWIFTPEPKHGKLIINDESIAEEFFKRICTEIENYIRNNKKIGVLLSGGMDSRIVAGAIDFLTKTGRLKDLDIIGLTWGDEGSRDVVYAKEISLRLNWKWKHYVVNAKHLKENILLTAVNGCEYSPIHLHGIPQIINDNLELDIILAGSYGDSVGRAEYFGWNIKFAPKIEINITNNGFVNRNIFQKSINDIKDDLLRYRQLFYRENQTEQRELDYQIHYMRRMLNPCMALLETNSTKFYQVFTHPDVYGYIWSIDFNNRTDKIYKHVLKYFKTPLADIPWARTGLKFDEPGGTPDNFKKDHHDYLNLLRRDDFFYYLKEKVLSTNIEKLNIFNMNTLNIIFSLLQKFPNNNLNYLEKICWIASLAHMIEQYDVKHNNEEFITNNSSNSYKIIYHYFFDAAKRKIIPLIKKNL